MCVPIESAETSPRFLIFVVAMPVFSYLPQAAVAALLVFASIRMAPVSYIAMLWRNDRRSCLLLIMTTCICVLWLNTWKLLGSPKLPNHGISW